MKLNLQKQSEHKIIKNIKNLVKLKKAIKDRISRGQKALFEQGPPLQK